MRRSRQSRFQQVIDHSGERVDITCQLRTVVARHLDKVDIGGDRPPPVPLHRATRSFLATEEAFRKIQDVQRKNLIVPLIGDFAGPKTIRAVGHYMKQHDAVLSVFYTSNVEMYLFQQGDDWKDFYENVATLPLNSASTFVRFAAGRGRRFGTSSGFFTLRSQMWSPVLEVIQSVRGGEFEDYGGVLDMSE